MDPLQIGIVTPLILMATLLTTGFCWLWFAVDFCLFFTQPFYGGTYFPPEDSYGRPGFKSLLRSIAAQWESKNDDFREAGDSFTKAIADAAASEARKINHSCTYSEVRQG